MYTVTQQILSSIGSDYCRKTARWHFNFCRRKRKVVLAPYLDESLNGSVQKPGRCSSSKPQPRLMLPLKLLLLRNEDVAHSNAYLHTHTCTHTHTSAHTHTHTHTYMHTHTHHRYTHTPKVHTHTHTHIHTHTHTQDHYHHEYCFSNQTHPGQECMVRRMVWHIVTATTSNAVCRYSEWAVYLKAAITGAFNLFGANTRCHLSRCFYFLLFLYKDGLRLVFKMVATSVELLRGTWNVSIFPFLVVDYFRLD